ncbi:MAG: tetratricopeptide repeat protein [Ignavibacteriaceae bacterium]|nr:tetratricopeptide repeat protein [Ignavibacteriaceae bacterium]
MVRSDILLLFFFILLQTEIYSQVYPDEKVDSLLRTGIRHIVNQDYKGAEEIINLLNKEFPNLPLGKIYLAANRIAEAYDYAEDFDEEFILKRLEEAKEQSEKLIDSDNENIWYQYFLALTEGYTAYFHAINESWFSALSTGVDAISEFDKILASDKKFYEAYIAIGTFEYWKSRKMEFIDWLPFSNDSRKIGIDRLKVAIDSSSYNSYLAINSLIWIYIDQNRFDDAIKISEKALKEFPDSRTFKWGLARAYEEIDPSKSIALYIEILNSYPVLENGNLKNEITLKHIIAQQYVKLGDKQNALKYCNEILSIKNIPEKTADELAERLERVKSLKKELTK